MITGAYNIAIIDKRAYILYDKGLLYIQHETIPSADSINMDSYG